MSEVYLLKTGCPEFTPVDGEHAGQTFRHGRQYSKIPRGYDARFVKSVRPEPALFGRQPSSGHPGNPPPRGRKPRKKTNTTHES